MGIKFRYLFISIAFLFVSFGFKASAQTLADSVAAVPSDSAVATREATAHKPEGFNISEVIFGHVKDAYEWHLFSVGNFKAVVYLPVVLYSPTKGFSVFSAAHFVSEAGEEVAYKGYEIKGGNTIVATDGSKVYDFSLTKDVVAMLIALAFLVYLFLSVAKKYKKNGLDKAPSGMQNAVEVCVQFIRDDLAKPALGIHYKRFMPLLLTIFFFVWIMSMLGLVPGGANLTGNIAVTGCLALVSFVVMLYSSKKHFWSHLFNPPGMPFFVKVILVPIELISLIIKPTALMIRLFANMLAGHIVLVCFILLIFIFAQMNVYVGSGFSIISVALSAFSMLIELLVAAIQAYIFAFLTAIFVGQMIEEHSHEAGERGFGFTDTEVELEL